MTKSALCCLTGSAKNKEVTALPKHVASVQCNEHQTYVNHTEQNVHWCIYVSADEVHSSHAAT